MDTTRLEEECRKLRANDLTKLGLYRVSDDGIRLVAAAMENNSSLQELVLTSPQWSRTGVEQLIEILRKANVSTLLIQLIPPEQQQGLLPLIFKANLPPCLYRLELWFTFDSTLPLTESTANAMIHMLRHNTTLRGFYLCCVSIPEEVCRRVSTALDDNDTLVDLGFACCTINDEGGAAFAELLRRNNRLEKLNLYSNDIGNVGATALAKALCGNTSLKALVLDFNNRIGVPGALAFGESLPLMVGLQELWLRVRRSDQAEFLSPLVEGLQYNRKIKFLRTAAVHDDKDARVTSLKQQMLFYLGDFHKRFLEKRYDLSPKLWSLLLNKFLNHGGVDVLSSQIQEHPELCHRRCAAV